MNVFRFCLTTVPLILVFSFPASAMISLSTLDPRKAEEIGVKVQSRRAGPDGVLIEISFDTVDAFEDYSPEKRFSRVELHVVGTGKGENEQTPLLTAALLETRPRPNRVAVSFSAERSQLDKFEVWIVIGGGLFEGGAYVLKMDEFVDTAKLDGKPKTEPGKSPDESASPTGSPPAS